jgi:transposase-like protein
MVEQIRCPEGHTKVWKKGCVPSRKGPKVRYVCYTCGRTFYKPKPIRTKKTK